MTLPLPTWLRPAPDSEAAERMAQGKSPWTEAVHLIWSVWVFVVPVFDPHGYDRTWWMWMLLSYPLFVLLYARTMLAPRRHANRYALGMVVMATMLLPVFPSGISYFVFGCLALRIEGAHALQRYLL